MHLSLEDRRKIACWHDAKVPALEIAQRSAAIVPRSIASQSETGLSMPNSRSCQATTPSTPNPMPRPAALDCAN